MLPLNIAQAFRAACADELAALKPGNVHVHAPGHRMTVQDFLRSAEAAAPFLAAQGARLGARVLGGVRATRDAVGQNTNLGILLLCAPLAAAAGGAAAARPATAARPAGRRLRDEVRKVLDAADLADARDVFAAIALASPGGLGDAPAHDVRSPAQVTLAVAMGAASERDSIARQWVTGFADIFEAGLPCLQAALDAAWPPPSATTRLHLLFMARWPDSHVARKHGLGVADQVRAEAAGMLEELSRAAAPDLPMAALLGWDASLKARGINPGTSADLTVATLFAHRLGAILRGRSDDG